LGLIELGTVIGELDPLLILLALSVVGTLSFVSLYYTSKRKFKKIKTQSKNKEIEKLKNRLDYIERLSEILSAAKTEEKSQRF